MGPHGGLIRALQAKIGPAFQLIGSEGWPWASATFVGERHRFVIGTGGASLAGIEEWEFGLFGHVVADIAVVSVQGAEVVIEALTVFET